MKAFSLSQLYSSEIAPCSHEICGILSPFKYFSKQLLSMMDTTSRCDQRLLKFPYGPVSMWDLAHNTVQHELTTIQHQLLITKLQILTTQHRLPIIQLRTCDHTTPASDHKGTLLATIIRAPPRYPAPNILNAPGLLLKGRIHV